MGNCIRAYSDYRAWHRMAGANHIFDKEATQELDVWNAVWQSAITVIQNAAILDQWMIVDMMADHVQDARHKTNMEAGRRDHAARNYTQHHGAIIAAATDVIFDLRFDIGPLVIADHEPWSWSMYSKLKDMIIMRDTTSTNHRRADVLARAAHILGCLETYLQENHFGEWEELDNYMCDLHDDHLREKFWRLRVAYGDCHVDLIRMQSHQTIYPYFNNLMRRCPQRFLGETLPTVRAVVDMLEADGYSTVDWNKWVTALGRSTNDACTREQLDLAIKRIQTLSQKTVLNGIAKTVVPISLPVAQEVSVKEEETAMLV